MTRDKHTKRRLPSKAIFFLIFNPKLQNADINYSSPIITEETEEIYIIMDKRHELCYNGDAAKL